MKQAGLTVDLQKSFILHPSANVKMTLEVIKNTNCVLSVSNVEDLGELMRNCTDQNLLALLIEILQNQILTQTQFAYYLIDLLLSVRKKKTFC